MTTDDPIVSLVRRAQADESRATRELAAARRLLLARPSVRPRSWTWAAPVLLAAAAVLLMMWLREAPHTFRVADGGTPTSSRRVEATQETPVRFDDGSELTLRSGSDAQVDATSTGAIVRLAHGEIHARVVHADETAWRFQAGPFEIEVVGTAFVLGWDELSQALHLRMERGAVIVRGPDGLVRRVEGVEHFDSIVSTVEATRDRREDEPASVPTPSLVPVATDVPVIARTQSRSGETGRSSATPAAAPMPEPLQAPSSSVGDVAPSAPLTFEQMLGQSTAEELLALGDHERISGDTQRSQSALLSVRSRFPGSDASARAAFLLARLAQERQHDPARAARLFRSYLRDAPTGALASEARGRLLEVLSASGDTDAERAARDYLAHDPSGPFAARARAVIDPGSAP